MRRWHTQTRARVCSETVRGATRCLYSHTTPQLQPGSCISGAMTCKNILFVRGHQVMSCQAHDSNPRIHMQQALNKQPSKPSVRANVSLVCTWKAATCAAHVIKEVRKECTAAANMPRLLQAMHAIACRGTRMQGCGAPSARPRSTRMIKNCVVLCIAAYHSKTLVSHTCCMPCPLGLQGACPQGRQRLSIQTATDAESRYVNNRPCTCRAHGDAAPAEQQEREPALCADADDDHVAGQLRHKVAHEEEPGSQPIQEIGEPNVLLPTKQPVSGAQPSCLPRAQQHNKLADCLSPSPSIRCRVVLTSESQQLCCLKHWQALHNQFTEGRVAEALRAVSVRRPAPCSERGLQTIGRRGPGTSAAPSRRGTGPDGSPCAAPRARRPPAQGAAVLSNKRLAGSQAKLPVASCPARHLALSLLPARRCLVRSLGLYHAFVTL